MTTIHQLKFEDLAGLKALYEDAFKNSVSDINRMTETHTRIKDNPCYLILCAKRDNQVVGSVMGVICNELFGQCRPFMVVENVAVLSSHRRLGIARQLLVSLEELAVKNNCTSILFVSSEHRTGAHKLYESLGFGADKVNGYRKRLK